MGVRSVLQHNTALGIGLSLAAVVLLGNTIFRQVQPLPEPGRPGAYFTIDDGKTQFVGYLGKLTEDAPAKVVAAEAAEKHESTGKPGERATFGSSSRQNVEASLPASAYLFKKPGNGQWTPSDQPQTEMIRQIQCPQGGNFSAVLPEESVRPKP